MKFWRLRVRLVRIIGFDMNRLNNSIAARDKIIKKLESDVASLRMAQIERRDLAELLLPADVEHLSKIEEEYSRELIELKEKLADCEEREAKLRARLPELALGATAAGPVVNQLRSLLTILLDKYESTRGISCDACSDTPQWHAMAEAQYLEAVVISQGTGLMSEAQARQRASAAVARLQAGALHRKPGVHAQWGLGFRWQHFPADEPFLVTSALVTRALIAARFLIDSADLAREGLAGLDLFPTAEVYIDGQPVALPVYAPSLSAVVDSTVVLWAQVVRAGGSLSDPGPEVSHNVGKALDWIDRRFVPGLGWAYSATRPVFDLMHQVYILEGLRGHPGATDIEERAIDVFAGFRAGAGYIDSLTLTSRAKALEGAERSGGQYPVFRGDHVLSARTDPARLWSLGGMLGSFGLFAMDGARRGYWMAQIRRFPVELLPTRFGADFRQEMHLARGTALALRAIRGA